ncbi:nuclear transport factor 2 family protein [Streptomyces sp. NPDC029526]|uniref:nuclear transport factor 2 family protein n=1 Tax=Streptomyces sp. NPDC029526 TaxID=3155728 RepID=UPI003402305D
MPEQDTAVDAAIEGELRLLDPEVRSSPERVDALLHPEFFEFGASGRVWDRAAIIDALTEEGDSGAPAATVSAMKAVEIAPGTVHLTFDTDHNGRRAHRSSLWRRTDQGWRLYFHQGTLFPPDEG